MSGPRIIPAFGHIADQEKASALSEPFSRADRFVIDAEGQVRSGSPLAVGAAYITGNTVSYGFGLAADLDLPLQVGQLFAEVYSSDIGGYHDAFNRAGSKLPNTTDGSYGRDTKRAQRAAELTKEAGLRTVAALAIMQLPDESMIGTIHVPQSVVDVLPLEGRETLIKMLSDPTSWVHKKMRETVPDARQRDAVTASMLQNSEESQRTAIMAAVAWLPTLAVAKRALSENDRIGDFMQQPRKKRRELLKQELKATRQV